MASDDGFDLANQVFNLEFCGKDDDQFWEFCKKISFTPYKTKCRKLKGVAELSTCENIVEFINSTYLKVSETCLLGPNKPNTEVFTQELSEERFHTIEKYCQYRHFKWWMILLILLACALVLSLSCWLFWRYYLRRKCYPTTREKREDLMSDSRYSSTPFSSDAGGSKLKSLYTVNESESGSDRKSGLKRPSFTRLSNKGSSRNPSTTIATISSSRGPPKV